MALTAQWSRVNDFGWTGSTGDTATRTINITGSGHLLVAYVVCLNETTSPTFGGTVSGTWVLLGGVSGALPQVLIYGLVSTQTGSHTVSVTITSSGTLTGLGVEEYSGNWNGTLTSGNVNTVLVDTHDTGHATSVGPALAAGMSINNVGELGLCLAACTSDAGVNLSPSTVNQGCISGSHQLGSGWYIGNTNAVGTNYGFPFTTFSNSVLWSMVQVALIPGFATLTRPTRAAVPTPPRIHRRRASAIAAQVPTASPTRQPPPWPTLAQVPTHCPVSL